VSSVVKPWSASDGVTEGFLLKNGTTPDLLISCVSFFLAHNVVNRQAEMRDFLAAIKNEPRLLTTIVSPSGEGISVSYKRR
jgi:hypothetical protein